MRRWFLSYGETIVVWVGWLWIRFVYATSCWQFVGRENLEAVLEPAIERPVIICFWHGRMAMMPCAWQWRYPFVMLLSQHSDGRLIGRVLKLFGIGCVEGSSRRGGAEAFIKLCHLASEKNVIGITPDGPKGPIYSVAPGIIALAKRTQAYIVPTSFSVKKSKQLKTWDHFLFPYPFNQGVFVAGQPIDATTLPEESEEAAQIIAEALTKTGDQADNIVARKPS